MADEKKQDPKAADKAAKDAQAKAQKEAAAKEKAQRDAQLKAQKEAAAKQKAEKDAQLKAQKDAQLKAQKEAAAKQKAEKDAQAKAQKEAAAKQKAEKDAQAKAQKEAAAKQKAEKNAQAKAQKEASRKEKPQQEKLQQEKAQQEKTQQEKTQQEKPQKEQKPKAPKAEKPAKVKKAKPPKMTRKERKELLARQKAREKELVEAGEIPLRNRYKPRGIFWRIFGITLAFILGVFAALGSIVGVGAVFVTKPARESLASLKDVMGFDAEEFISDEYLDMSIIKLVQSVMEDVGALGDPSELTLATFSKYTPLIDTYLQDIIDENLKDLGITLDIDSLRNVKFSEYANYVQTDLLPQVTLGPILKLDKNVSAESLNENAPLYALCYGTYGTDYTVEDGAIVQVEGGMKPLSVADLMDFSGNPEGGNTPAPTAASNDPNEGEGGFMARIKSIPLGVFLGFNIRLESEKTDMNGMVYSLCYGNEDDDYGFRSTTVGGETFEVVEVRNEEKMLTLNTLLTNSDGIFDSISLGTVLGLNTATELANRENNRMMYALCYGVEGEDYDVVDDKIKMRDGKSERTLGYLTSNMNAVINDIEVDSILDISPKTEAIIRTIAYGNEMAKDDQGNYLKDAEGNYQTEDILDEQGQPTGKKQYVGDGKYIIDGEGENAKIVMLDDPNNPGKKYQKKTIGALTSEDSDLIGGITLGSILDIDSNSSGIMQAMRDWTISDLTDQGMIESLKIGDILGIEAEPDGSKPQDVSNIMWALRDKTIEDLTEQDTIDSLKLSDVLDIGDDAGILSAMSDWTLNDLSKQSRIERLKLSQILDINENDPNTSPIMKAMKDWRISDLTEKDKVDTLTLGDVLSIGDGAPQMLAVLKDMSLGEISTSIDTLTLSEVIDLSTLGDNKILSALKDTEIRKLGEAIDGLTVEDVFGDEIWSYTTNFVDDQRPEAYDKSKVHTYYYLTATPTTEVTPGWYKGSDATGWTLVPDAEVKHGSYTETHVDVTREVSYLVVDYDKPSTQWTPYTGDTGSVQTDSYGDYYFDADGNRVDLEPVYTYKNGAATVTGQRILTEKVENQPDKYYYIEKTDVTLRYAAGDKTYAASEVTRGHKTEDGTALRAYHAGVWYLLLGEDGSEATPKVTELGGLVTGVSTRINTITLWEMYIHELITADPSYSLAIPKALGLTSHDDLKDLTISEVINLVQSLAGSLNGLN